MSFVLLQEGSYYWALVVLLMKDNQLTLIYSCFLVSFSQNWQTTLKLFRSTAQSWLPGSAVVGWVLRNMRVWSLTWAGDEDSTCLQAKNPKHQNKWMFSEFQQEDPAFKKKNSLWPGWKAWHALITCDVYYSQSAPQKGQLSCRTQDPILQTGFVTIGGGAIVFLLCWSYIVLPSL